MCCGRIFEGRRDLMERAEVSGRRIAIAGVSNMLTVMYIYRERIDVPSFRAQCCELKLSDRLPHPLVHVIAKTAR